MNLIDAVGVALAAIEAEMDAEVTEDDYEDLQYRAGRLLDAHQTLNRFLNAIAT